MKGILILLFLLPTAFAEDSSQLEISEVYQQVLDRHLEKGHISQAEVEKQQYYYEKDKAWRSEFGKKLRGVASSLKSPRDVIELDNPAIEIPVN